jgi:hypothetical protein
MDLIGASLNIFAIRTKGGEARRFQDWDQRAIGRF